MSEPWVLVTAEEVEGQENAYRLKFAGGERIIITGVDSTIMTPFWPTVEKGLAGLLYILLYLKMREGLHLWTFRDNVILSDSMLYDPGKKPS